jgi:lysozyme
MLLYGIDVSNWQGMINWDTLNNDSSLAYVYMLISDGTYRGRPSGAAMSVESSFVRNKSLCKKASGFYHFARPHSTNPILMADAAFRDGGRMDLPPVLDLEEYSELGPYSLQFCIDWTGQWLKRMESLDGRRPVLYCGAFFKRFGVHRTFMDHLWWLPSYTANTTPNPIVNEMRLPSLNGPRNWDIWQYTSTGRMPGIAGNVDRNVMDASLLMKLVNIEEADMPSLDEIAHLIRTTAPRTSFVAHCDNSNYRSIRLTSLGFGPHSDIAFQCFDDGTMRHVTNDQVGGLVFIGVPDLGYREDSWWNLCTLKSRDFIGEFPNDGDAA